MNPLGRCKSALETLSTSTAQANISNCCDTCSEQSFLFPSVKLKWQDKVAAWTRVVPSVSYIYPITTGELGSSLKHRDEPVIDSREASSVPDLSCGHDAVCSGLQYQWKDQKAVSWSVTIQSLKTTTHPRPEVSWQQKAIMLHTSGTRRDWQQEKVQKCVYQSSDESPSAAG